MIYFIVNKSSRTGEGMSVWCEAKEVLRRRNVEYKAFSTEYKGHATVLAEKISNLPADEINLVVVGGDGTVNEAINGIRDFEKVRFGVIPTGSGNDYARGLDLKGSTEDYINKMIDSVNTDAIDIGSVRWNGSEDPRYFAISAGIGLDAIVCKKALTSKQKTFLNKLHLGKLTYLLLTVETLFSMETARVKAEFDGEYSRKFEKLIFSAAMNFRAEGGGVPMSPQADARDGMLSMCFAHGLPRWKTFFVLPFLVLAKHEKLSCFFLKDCRKCRIRLDRPVVLHADGEYLGDVTEVEFECLPARLRIMV